MSHLLKNQIKYVKYKISAISIDWFRMLTMDSHNAQNTAAAAAAAIIWKIHPLHTTKQHNFIFNFASETEKNNLLILEILRQFERP